MKLGLILILLLSSCSSTRPKASSLKYYKSLENFDYIDHLASFSKIYVNSPGISLIKLSSRSKRYLKKIYKRIQDKNELLFKDLAKAKFYIVKSKSPFHFSLPKGSYFFSSALVKKFFKYRRAAYSSLNL